MDIKGTRTEQNLWNAVSGPLLISTRNSWETPSGKAVSNGRNSS